MRRTGRGSSIGRASLTTTSPGGGTKSRQPWRWATGRSTTTPTTRMRITSATLPAARSASTPAGQSGGAKRSPSTTVACPTAQTPSGSMWWKRSDNSSSFPQISLQLTSVVSIRLWCLRCPGGVVDISIGAMPGAPAICSPGIARSRLYPGDVRRLPIVRDETAPRPPRAAQVVMPKSPVEIKGFSEITQDH